MEREDWLTRTTQELDVSVVGQLSRPGMRSLFFALGDILQASDNLSRVINSYKTIVEGQVLNGEVSAPTLPDSEGAVFQSLTRDPPDSPVPAPSTGAGSARGAWGPSQRWGVRTGFHRLPCLQSAHPEARGVGALLCSFWSGP